MIIQKNLTDKNKSIYRCDMCKEEKTLADIYKLSKQNIGDKGKIKIYDLCSRCYKLLVKSIENYCKRRHK